MKAFVASGLLVLIFGMWRCSGIEPVSMECDYFKFRVIAKRALFYPDELIDPDELLLGLDCPITSVRPDELEFYYSINACGTYIEHAFDGTIVNSWLTYTPKNVSDSIEFQLQCIMRRLLQSELGNEPEQSPECLSERELYNVDDPSDLDCQLLPQCWFLVMKKYCNTCRCFHFPTDWKMIYVAPIL
ncbi:oocyte-secreted protein 3-like [Apodemus sylvaticus]|uniref:oocyte-secreted protein 3-like n=1 Tax=Apodemus sylvaticus TaxID=10129 RepID=UPI002241B3FF|nr:oocyte-secreted protein 3-like [Apodemus sylvaticus]